MHISVLQAISLALADEQCDALRGAVCVVLEARQQTALARALQRDAVAEEAETQRIPDFGKGRTVTLGERKSLARSNDRNLLARVLRDPHPHVIRILLGNPTVTETDVVRLCARRPVSTEVLREVFRSARWIVRYQIKVALALNPYTPLDVALQLTPQLQAPDLGACSPPTISAPTGARRAAGCSAAPSRHAASTAGRSPSALLRVDDVRLVDVGVRRLGLGLRALARFRAALHRDLLIGGDAALEAADRAADALAELRQARCAKHEQQDHQDDDQL